MPKSWTESKIQNFIKSEIEESLTLEYKSGEALGRSDQQKREITKDVSAMANSAGGLLIYGIGEFSEPDKRHLPEKIVPVDRMEISREWIEQIINSIRPRINGIVIYSVPLKSGEKDAVYVIEIPQSHTAHQANNHRYYKRFNFQSVPMEDYEIRDVMFREQTPEIKLTFLFEIGGGGSHFFKQEKMWENPITPSLLIRAQNTGSQYAEYIACSIDVPIEIVGEIKDKIDLRDGGKYYRHRLFNIAQELGKNNARANFPLLRNMTRSWKIPLKEGLESLGNDNLEIKWKVYADNALPKEGKISFEEIDVVDLRNKSRNL